MYTYKTLYERGKKMQMFSTSWPYSYIIRTSVASSDIAYGAYNGNNMIFW